MDFAIRSLNFLAIDALIDFPTKCPAKTDMACYVAIFTALADSWRITLTWFHVDGVKIVKREKNKLQPSALWWLIHQVISIET